MFHSSTSFSMDLGCPLLRGSSVRRLRRRAATVGYTINVFCDLLSGKLSNRLSKSVSE